MSDVTLKCSCGTVKGTAHKVNPTSVNRLVCHCEDCHAFATYLKKEGSILDAYGGTEIYQMPMAHVSIDEGHEQLHCIRLTPQGLIRWYAACCKTPIGNTVSAGMPFVGVIHNFIDDPAGQEENLGPLQGYVFKKKATGLPDERQKSSDFKVIIKMLYKMLVWKIRGLDKPSAFFDVTKQPVSTPKILSEG